MNFELWHTLVSQNNNSILIQNKTGGLYGPREEKYQWGHLGSQYDLNFL